MNKLVVLAFILFYRKLPQIKNFIESVIPKKSFQVLITQICLSLSGFFSKVSGITLNLSLRDKPHNIGVHTKR